MAPSLLSKKACLIYSGIKADALTGSSSGAQRYTQLYLVLFSKWRQRVQRLTGRLLVKVLDRVKMQMRSHLRRILDTQTKVQTMTSGCSTDPNKSNQPVLFTSPSWISTFASRGCCSAETQYQKQALSGSLHPVEDPGVTNM